MGVSAWTVAEVGGVVFSLSFVCAIMDRSLLERFILPNMADKFAEDLVFLGELAPSLLLVGTLVVAAVETMLFGRLFAGDEGGDCTFPCRSPNTLAFAACGWSGGSIGTDFVLIALESVSGDVARFLDERVTGGGLTSMRHCGGALDAWVLAMKQCLPFSKCGTNDCL